MYMWQNITIQVVWLMIWIDCKSWLDISWLYYYHFWHWQNIFVWCIVISSRSNGILTSFNYLASWFAGPWPLYKSIRGISIFILEVLWFLWRNCWWIHLMSWWGCYFRLLVPWWCIGEYREVVYARYAQVTFFSLSLFFYHEWNNYSYGFISLFVMNSKILIWVDWIIFWGIFHTVPLYFL